MTDNNLLIFPDYSFDPRPPRHPQLCVCKGWYLAGLHPQRISTLHPDGVRLPLGKHPPHVQVPAAQDDPVHGQHIFQVPASEVWGLDRQPPGRGEEALFLHEYWDIPGGDSVPVWSHWQGQVSTILTTGRVFSQITFAVTLNIMEHSEGRISSQITGRHRWGWRESGK